MKSVRERQVEIKRERERKRQILNIGRQIERNGKIEIVGDEISEREIGRD